MLEGQKYILCTHYTSHLERVTCSWLTFPCNRYGTDDSETSSRPTSCIYLEPDTSPKSPSLVSIVSMENRLQPHTQRQHLENQVHSGVCGLMPHQPLGGASYFISFIDDATRKKWAYLGRTKDRLFSVFQEWLTMVENKSDRKLKCL